MPKKKVVFISLSLILVLALTVFFGACSKTTTVTQTATATATTTTTIKPIELKWTSQWNVDTDDGKADLILAKMIEDRTNGRVKITYYQLETLGKSTEWVTMLKGGAAEMGTLMLPTYPGQFDIELIGDIPMLGIPDRATLNNLMWELNNKDYFVGLRDFKVMAFLGGPPLTLFFRDKKVTKVEDFNGMKLRGSAPVVNSFYEALGATPVAIPGPEIYMSIDRKVIDGYSTAWPYVLQVKLNEVSKYVIWDPPVGRGCPTVVMSKQAWDNLPPDIQKIVDQAIEDYKAEYLKYYEPIDKAAVERLTGAGIEVYSLSDTEVAKLRQIAGPVGDQWVAEREAKGLPAKAAYDTVLQFLGRK